MAVTFSDPNAFNGRVYPFHVEPVARDIMGYALSGVSKGDLVFQGTPLVCNDNDTNGQKTAKIAKYGHIVSKIDAKNFIVDDLGRLAVGDKIYKSGTSDKSTVTLSTISAIDKAKKKITLSANNSDFAAGDTFLEGKSVTTGEGQSAVTTTEPVDIPNRMVARTETMGAHPTISATHRADVISNVVDYPAEWLNSETFPGTTVLRGCPGLFFIHQ